MAQARRLVEESAADERRAVAGLVLRGAEARMRLSNDLSLRASLDRRPPGGSKLLVQQRRSAEGTTNYCCSGGAVATASGAASAAASTDVPKQSEVNVTIDRDTNGSSNATTNERRRRESGGLPPPRADTGVVGAVLVGGRSSVVSTRTGFDTVGSGSGNSDGDGGGDGDGNGGGGGGEGGGAGNRDLGPPPEQDVDSKENHKAMPSDGLHQLKQEILDLEGKILGRLDGGSGGAGGNGGPPKEISGRYGKTSSGADKGNENRDVRGGNSDDRDDGNTHKKVRGATSAKLRKGSSTSRSTRAKDEDSTARARSSSSSPFLRPPRRSTAGGGSTAACAHGRGDKSRVGEKAYSAATAPAPTSSSGRSGRTNRTGPRPAGGRPPKKTATACTRPGRGSGGGSESCEDRSSVAASSSSSLLSTEVPAPRRPQRRGAPPSRAGAGPKGAGVGIHERAGPGAGAGVRPRSRTLGDGRGRGVCSPEGEATGGRRRRREGDSTVVVAGEGMDGTSVGASCPLPSLSAVASPCRTSSRGGSLLSAGGLSAGGSLGETSSQGTGGGGEHAGYAPYEPGTWPLSSVSDYANGRGLGRSAGSGGGGSSSRLGESSEDWERSVLESLTSRNVLSK